MFLFLVNRPKESWAGIRAEKFKEELEKLMPVSIVYRERKNFGELLKFLKSIIQYRPRFLYILDLGYASGGAGLLGKILMGAKIVLDTGDIGYEVSKSIGDRTQLEIFFMEFMERLMWRLSTLILVRGIEFKYYMNKMGYKNVFFIPDAVDTQITTPNESIIFKQQFGLDKYFTIGVLGTSIWSKKLNMCYGWEIVEVIKILKDLPVRGVIIGEGNGIPFLKKKANDYGIADRILFIDRIPYEDIPKYLTLIDICVSTQTNDIVGNIRTTGKLPLYLACNKYILATKVGEAKYILPEEMLVPYHGTVDLDYPQRLAESIREIYESPQNLDKRRKLREIAKGCFEYKMLSKKVANYIYNISKDRKN